MSRHWTKDEDEFIHSYSEVGDFIGSQDLGRRDSAVGPRVRKLKKTGAWDALTIQKMAEGAYTLALGGGAEWDADDVCICSWMQRNARAIIEAMEAGEDIRCAAGVAETVVGTEPDEADVLINACREAAEMIVARRLNAARKSEEA